MKTEVPFGQIQEQRFSSKLDGALIERSSQVDVCNLFISLQS